MIYAPLIKSFFCQSIPNNTESLDVALDRIDISVKAGWACDSTRPTPVLGISSSGMRIVKEFHDAQSCEAAGFELIGPSREFAIYLDWEHYLAERPIEQVD